MKKIKLFIGYLLVLVSFLAPSFVFAGSYVDKDIKTEIDEILNDFNFKTQGTNIHFYSMSANDTKGENIEIRKNMVLYQLYLMKVKEKLL